MTESHAPIWHRPTWLDIDISAVAHNVRTVQATIGAGRKLFAVVKADGYGCGAVEASKAAAEAGAYAIATSHPDLVPKLRAAGVDLPVLLYPGTLPDSAEALVDLDVIPTIHDEAGLAAFISVGRPVAVFVKVDCGNGRFGFLAERAEEVFAAMKTAPHLRLAGIYTQLRDQDDVQKVRAQISSFAAACHAAEAEGYADFDRMASASTTMLATDEFNFTAVNPGRMLYGHMPRSQRRGLGLRPAMVTLRSRIIQLRDVPAGDRLFGHDEPVASARRVAGVPLGYLDGLDQGPPISTGAFVRGREAPVVRMRSMEHMVLDVTDVPDARVGDEVVIFDNRDDSAIDLWDLATRSGVPQMEFMCRMGMLAPRRYVR